MMFKKRKLRNRINKAIAVFLLLLVVSQIAMPTVAFALTSGPTAPEATSFEPIDTTDMVNPLTGDFTYNLPLLEVPGPEGGYPLSLSYHAGIQPNEDASWVGLGWTLNPGAITRSVNGFPDDWSGSNVSRRDYWDGGSTSTYSVGFSVGLPGNLASVNFGLSFSQDTYQGFGTGMNFGVSAGIDKSPLGLSFGFGTNGYGGGYASAGIDVSGRIGGTINGSLGLQASTNFENVAGSLSGGIGSSGASLLGASISTANTQPSFSLGGVSATTFNDNAGKISTDVSSVSIGIPIFPGLSLSLGYSKVRYWSDETSNTAINGSLNYTSVASPPDNTGYDNYGLLDPDKNIVTSPDPSLQQGGAYPNFDVYSVSAQGLSGNMRPYDFQDQLFGQNRKDGNTRTLQYFGNRNNILVPPAPAFRFVNDFSNSYRQTYPDYSNPNADLKTTAPPFDASPSYGNNDANYGYSGSNYLAGSRSINVYTINSNGTINGTGFMYPKVFGYTNRMLHINKGSFYNGSHIAGFKITNQSGVTYHYNLPAYSYEEETFQEKIGGNSSNRQTKTEGYAYTWYLTSITGPDYVDKNNNQMVDDGDWGYWVNFEYGKWSDDYVWRNPSEGYHRDDDGEFQDVSMGKKEIYYLNAIRTRSHIALFEKDIRLDGRGAAPDIFMKASQNRYNNDGSFNTNSAKVMRLHKVYLLNAADSAFVKPTTSGTEFYNNVLDRVDVETVGRTNLETKAIRVIDLEYDYKLCKGTANSFYDSANQNAGKLTLNAVRTRGFGGVNLMPATEFEYELSGGDLKTASGTLSTSTFLSSSGSFEVGDLLETAESNSIFCGVVVAKQSSAGSYTYTLKNSKYSGSAVTKQMRNTKNPPYNKDAYDMWGTYKSDYEYNSIENLSRMTTEASNASADVWSLRKIKTSLGSDIVVSYEGDTYNKSVLNGNWSFLISGLTSISSSRKKLSITNAGFDLRKFFSSGDYLSFLSYMKWTHPNFGVIFEIVGTTNGPEGTTDAQIVSVTANEIEIDIGADLAVKINVGSFTSKELLGGNLKVVGKSKYFGGGIRVKSLKTISLNDNIYSINYAFDLPQTTTSSGCTSYEPAILDPVSIATSGSYKSKVYADSKNLYIIAREVPPPGVFYEYVTIENEVTPVGQAVPIKAEGKTVFQYEVFRDNMIGRVKATADQTGSANGKTQYIKNYVIKKFTGSLGALKRTTRYDPQNRKLSETINNYLHDGLENLSLTDFMAQYEARLAQFNYQGLLKERYSEVKEVKNGSSYDVMATNAAREELPVVALGQTTKDYVTGIETSTENKGFDFYSGAVTKTKVKDVYGNYFMTEIEPAYRKYGSMGLKSMSSSKSNMLTQEATRTVYKVDVSDNKLGVVSASAQTWGTDTRVDDENGAQTTTGQPNIWRPKATYNWLPEGSSTDNMTAYASFTPFSYTGSNGSSWKKTSEITRYNVFSAALEVTDINGNYTVNRRGYKDSKITVASSAARYREIAYTGAEDALLPNGKLSTGITLGNDAAISSTLAHTGSNSISIPAGKSGVTYDVPLAELDPVRRDYHVSVWVRSSGDVSGARLFYRIDNQADQTVTPTFQKFCGSWYLLELKVPSTALTSGTTLTVGCKNTGSSTVYFDDFRFQPTNAPTTSYVYSKYTGQLTYILDNNNAYTRYMYDAVGRLISVYKETIGKSSIWLAKDIAYNYGKPLMVTTGQTSFYARVEYSNYTHSYTGNSNDNTTLDKADVYVKFYTNSACTIPFTLTVPVMFEVTEHYISSDWVISSFDQLFSSVYSAQSGTTSVFLGSKIYSYQHNWYDQQFGSIYENYTSDLTLSAYGLSYYIPLATKY